MILTPYAPNDAFSLIVWLLINQSRHIRYQMNAEYLSYWIVLFISLLMQDLKKKLSKRVQILSFCNNIFERG